MPKVTTKYLTDRKDFILECTNEVLKEKPLYQITMRDIIKKAGFSQGAIYRYYAANSHFLRPAGPHFPASQGHIKRPVLEIGRAERGLRPANQYRALSQKAMLSQSVR